MAFAAAHFAPRRKNDAPPEELVFGLHIWDWFVELHNSRQSGFAANPISFGEIESFCRLTGAAINPWELSVIRRMDQVTLSIINRTGKPDTVDRQTTAADVAEAKLRIRGAARNRRVVKRSSET
ncbi:phage tail assembly chaperone [Ensifer sp.]|uniref:phage tail assembly chaperone n=1 Tax=Ensifer sp. TaxID=1872086 RepID=UPI003BB8BD3E